MGMLNLYDWGLPRQGTYLQRYKDNDSLYNMARALWSNLDSAAIYFLITFIVLGIAVACFYYYGYNKWPKRKYKVGQWELWLVITAALTIVLTLGLGSVIVSSNLQEKFGFLLRISLVNGLYSIGVYLITSFIICNIPVSTNAYRFLKIDRLYRFLKIGR